MLLRLASVLAFVASLFTLSAAHDKEILLDFKLRSINRVAKTYVKVIGDLKPNSRPFIALHGGPGVTHDYLKILSDVTKSKESRGPLIVYDQIGNGRSTHFPQFLGNTTFWTEQLFLDELDNVLKKLNIKEYDLLGHSWGGMLAARHASLQPRGLKNLILMSAPASMPLWIEGVNRLRTKLPREIQDALDEGDRTGDMESPEYQAAVQFFYSRHLITLDPIPDAIAAGFEWIEKDPTVYLTMNGPNEFSVTGSLRNWTVIDQIRRIKVPTLVTNGATDEATDTAVAPYVQKLPKGKYVKFLYSSHMAHYEERSRFMRTVAKFLYD